MKPIISNYKIGGGLTATVVVPTPTTFIIDAVEGITDPPDFQHTDRIDIGIIKFWDCNSGGGLKLVKEGFGPHAAD